MAMAAVIGVLVSLGILEPFGGDGEESRPGSVIAGSGKTGADVPAGSPSCFGRHFEGIPADRVGMLEEGAYDSPFLRQDQPLDQPAGLGFTVAGKSVGALRFQYFPDGDLFKVEGVVDGDSYRVLFRADARGYFKLGFNRVA